MRGDAHTARIAAATVLFNADPHLLRQLLKALREDHCTLFVFINGPASDDIEALLTQLDTRHIFRSRENAGQGAGLDAVIRAASDEGFSHILLLDQDSTPPPGLARTLHGRMTALEHAGINIAAVGPRLVPPDGSTYLPISYWRWQPRGRKLSGAVAFLPTSGSLISMDAWHRIGSMRADYFIDGIDVEWGYRAWDSGWANILIDDVTMIHRWGDELPDESRAHAWPDHKWQAARLPPERIYFYVRNAVHGLRLAHMPWRWKVQQVLRLTAQVATASLAKRDRDYWRCFRRAVRDGWNGRLGPLPAELNRGTPSE